METFHKEKYSYIQHQDIQKEEHIIKKKEDKIRNIFRTLEKNAYLTEKKKQDWIDKALEIEDKKKQ